MWYAILADDSPGTLDKRMEVRPRHLARLEQLKELAGFVEVKLGAEDAAALDAASAINPGEEPVRGPMPAVRAAT